MAYEQGGVWYGDDGRAHGSQETAEADDAARKRVGATDWGSVESRLKEGAAARGSTYDVSDLEGIKRNFGYDRPTGSLEDLIGQAFSRYDQRANNTPGGGGGDGGGSSVSQQWSTQPVRSGRGDDLYSLLLGRVNQGLTPDRNDPAIRAQADAYAANQERARRNYLSDTAERSGPFANLRGERRMASERYGAQTGAFEAELLGREVAARRDEVAQALQLLTGRVSAEEEMGLRRELADLEAQLRREGLATGNDQFMRDLALREWDRGNYWDFNWAGLA